MKNNKKKIIIIACLLGMVVCLGIGFAAFSTTLKINGSAKVSPEGENYKVFFVSAVDSLTRYDRGDFDGEANSDKVDPGKGHFEDDTTFTNTGVTFSEDGQSVDYKFYILNAGKYDAHITNLDIGKKTCTPGEDADPALAASACSSINLSVILGDEGNQTTYTSSQAISDHVLPKGTWEQIIVRITYPEGSTLVDGELDVKWEDIQVFAATSASLTPALKTKGAKLITGDINNLKIGDLFVIGEDEGFYIIEKDNDNNTVNALARYSLLIGEDCTFDEETEEEYCTPVPKNDPKYGLQNSESKGMDCLNYEKGTSVMLFADKAYWGEYIDEEWSWINGYEPLSSNEWPYKYRYAYDPNSNIYNYLEGNNGYKEYLSEYIDIENIGLLRYHQAIALGCDKNNNCTNENTMSIPWLYDRTYYLGDIRDKDSLWIMSNGEAIIDEEANLQKSDGLEGSKFFSIRPTITISINDIHE